MTTPAEPRCPKCAHVLAGGEHADWCMTARDPEALKALRTTLGAASSGRKIGEVEG